MGGLFYSLIVYYNDIRKCKNGNLSLIWILIF